MTDQPRYFIGPDGDGEPTLWDRTPDPWNDTEPLALVRRCDVTPEAWAWVVAHQEPALNDSPRRRDSFMESRYTPWGEEEFSVTRLPGGQTVEGPRRIVGAAPGAPFAGDRVTAATTRPRDLLDAAKRQQIRAMIQEGQL